MAAELAMVAVDVTAAGTDRLYTYEVPPALANSLAPGQWIKVPFGSRVLVGLYVGCADAVPAGVTLKRIQGVLPDIPPIPPALIQLARWTADHYLATFAAALRLLLPTEARRQKVHTLTVTSYRLTLEERAVAETITAIRKKAPRQSELLEYMVRNGNEASLPVLVRVLGESVRQPIKAALQKGWIASADRIRRRDPFGMEMVARLPPPTLTAAQGQALHAIEQELLAPTGLRQPVLVRGVTGSGKTEIYLRAIAAVQDQGRESIFLVPEISLTPLMIGRFRSRFGKAVAVLHSALSAGERYDEWQRIRRGEVSIVVGARSAIFAPFANVGLILIDEEHEHSYKQESPAPCYHAREVAEERARLEGALLVLGSATPALESYYKAMSGSYRLATLKHRVLARPMPEVTLIDMRAELRSGNRSIFSIALQEALDRIMARGEQAILFLNRRGYNTFIMCRSCGEAVTCHNCAVAMTYHLGDNQLACHYCDHRRRVPSFCPSCQSKQIRHMGAGTERVEEELNRLYPHIRVARMDVDTTRRKGSHATILHAFGEERTDVLVGTQMIAKGLDFPGVTLVGVVLADTALNLPDFRAAERTFQLVTQVAGRAGRGLKPGHVLVQSYQPDHYSLLAAKEHNYTGFYGQEIEFRRSMGYPPFAALIHLVVAGPDEEQVAESARAIASLLVKGVVAAEVLGPAPAPLARLRGQFRHHLVLKGSNLTAMSQQVRQAFAAAGGRWRRSKEIKLSVDVGPVSIL